MRSVPIGGVRVRRGSRVRLRPVGRADVLDPSLTGRVAEVTELTEDLEGRVQLVVSLDGDAGRDFATGLGHRFFFSPEEVEPVVGETAPPTARVLIAGIGNVFLADDAFGPEVVAALRRRPVAAGVHVADFGIRGMDLAHRLLDGYDVAVFVDAAPRGGAPGTLYLIEPAPVDAAAPAPPDAHGMDPVRVLALAHRLSAAGQGGAVPRVVVLAASRWCACAATSPRSPSASANPCGPPSGGGALARIAHPRPAGRPARPLGRGAPRPRGPLKPARR
ncbi:hypothetical protein BLA24_08265 [Streptomyces cinnamoneus]|uniref:Hydrogenase maturation protease n=1 Tax=Streptomyces cinnamoneus TaxID=53446 RepID=A0A2G1XM40_STRCJ|nr:hypothetical protein BLA24_08265 [Streptomyces cinnamoneus]